MIHANVFGVLYCTHAALGLLREQIAKRFGDVERLTAEDIAGAVLYAIGQSKHVSINEVLVRPSGQLG
jgi:NADP-dependent 3-hydroxy acid dehydrogenase YdfG